MSCETLILFTRFPVAGRAKTRLIPRLGREGAARLQREMTQHVLARVWPLISGRGVHLEVRFDGGTEADMRRWLGGSLNYLPQGNGDLGERMARAAGDVIAAGARAVVIIGADCPALDAALIGRALNALRTNRVVFGPARDGGYYLAGLTAPAPQLFEGIPWGSSQVLTASVARARQIGVEPFLLPELSDVDEPADLEVWDRARQAARTVSVIIPTLDEAENLPGTLECASAGEPVEVLVADGGSRDATCRVAQSGGARLLTCAAGRARQMNAGAAAARGETLLFLHADTLLPANWHDAVLAAFRRPDAVGGAFRFRIRDAFCGRRIIEGFTNLRSRLWRMPYGDQALFVRRWAFDELGGFPDLPILEDYEFVRRLRRLGRLAHLDAAAVTSGRRWRRLGVPRTTLVNQLVILGYHFGVTPEKLAALYRRQTPCPRPARAKPEEKIRTDEFF